MKSRYGFGEYIMVRCVSINESLKDNLFTIGNIYRAKFATKEEFEKRNIWVWVENNRKTANGYGKIYFETLFIDVKQHRMDKLEQLGI
jgi:hypothetical protein